MEDKIPKIDWGKIREIKERAEKQEPWDFGDQFGVNPHAYLTAQIKPEKKEKFLEYLDSGSAEEIDKLILWLEKEKESFPILLNELSPKALISLLEKISTPTLKNVFDNMVVEAAEKEKEKDVLNDALYKKMGTIPDGRDRLALLRKKVENPLGEPESFPEEQKMSEGQIFSQSSEEPFQPEEGLGITKEDVESLQEDNALSRKSASV